MEAFAAFSFGVMCLAVAAAFPFWALAWVVEKVLDYQRKKQIRRALLVTALIGGAVLALYYFKKGNP